MLATCSSGEHRVHCCCGALQAGFGMTAPDPRWHPRDMTMFDVGRWQQLDHEDIQPRIAHVMGNMLQAVAGGCNSGFCKVGPAEGPDSCSKVQPKMLAALRRPWRLVNITRGAVLLTVSVQIVAVLAGHLPRM